LCSADADIERAAKACAGSIARNSGQICSANTRIYVHESIVAQFSEVYKNAYIAAAKHGNPHDNATTQGPLVDAIQFERVMGYIDSGKDDGKLLIGGKRKYDKGYFIEPTVFTDVPETARVNKEEIFGPVRGGFLFVLWRNH
jgi:aldehyde dehydrogenase (NAD+)